MRKVSVLFFVLIISILVSSCSSNISEGKKETPIQGSYQELDKLPENYDSELAKDNGDVVNVHGEISNIEKFERFIKEYENKEGKKSDMVRITTYTIEGDAIIFDLITVGKDTKLIEDNTRDKFAGMENKKIKEYKVVDISKENLNGSIYYAARTVNGEVIPLIYLGDGRVQMSTEKDSYKYSNDKVKITITNNSQEILEFGTYYRVQRSIDGNWTDVPFKKDIGFHDLLIILKPSEKYDETIYFNMLQSALSQGRYRIVKYFSTKDEKDFMESCEFDIN